MEFPIDFKQVIETVTVTYTLFKIAFRLSDMSFHTFYNRLHDNNSPLKRKDRENICFFEHK